MQFEIRQIHLDRIDLSDTQYRISITDACEDLVQSIKAVGLINLPILLEVDSGYVIISGLRRIKACRILGWSDAFARILDRGTPPLQCLQVSIADSAGNRNLNVLEKAIAVEKLSSHYPDYPQLCRALEALGLPVNSVMIDKCKRLRSLPMPVQYAVAADILSLTMALELESVDGVAATALTELFERLRPTFNQQKEIFANLKDIARCDEIPLQDLIRSPFISDLLNHSDTDRKNIIQLLRKRLRNRRYPSIAAAEADFYESVAALALPDNTQLVPPKDFEDTRYRFIISFETSADLARHADRLAAMSGHPILKKILNRRIADS